MFSVHIETGNSAFQGNYGIEIARILRDLAMRLDNTGSLQMLDQGSLRDANGNTVGRWTFDAR